MRIGRSAKRSTIATKKFAFGKQLCMHFQANNHFVFVIFYHVGKGKEVRDYGYAYKACGLYSNAKFILEPRQKRS